MARERPTTGTRDEFSGELKSLSERLSRVEVERERAHAMVDARKQAREQALSESRERRQWLALGREQAAKELERWRSSADPYERAEELRVQGNREAACAAWREVAEAAPGTPAAGNAMMELAIDRQGQGKPKDALKAAQAVLEEHANEHSFDGQLQACARWC